MPLPSRLPSRQRSAQKSSKLFDPKVFLANAGSGRTLRHYRLKQVIFSQAERADTVFYIQEGTARLSAVSTHGKEAIIASDQPVRMATATAVTKCSVLRVENREMLRTLHEQPRFSDMFVAYGVGRHNRTQSDLVDQLFHSTEKQLVPTLLMLTHFGKEEALVPGKSQQTLAGMIGIRRSHVNVFLNKFKKLGFIEYNGGLRVQFPPQCCAPRLTQDRLMQAPVPSFSITNAVTSGLPREGVPF
jgi:CRP-like cAMP-binding protein